ncbi:MAG: hypothetical protein EXQ85_08790 [Alphaproteobacteria bacterium]|nr:hypothetical protein [Alphaproteobacteria bacterium]
MFLVLFQLTPGNEGLVQVLMLYRGSRPTQGDFIAVLAALEDQSGPAQGRTIDSDYTASFPSFSTERRWQFPTTQVHLRYTDPNMEPLSRVRKELVLRYSASGRPAG